ncbi:MAG: hypothetical protein GY786_00430 [Proteobacteria bacterium]|nr:hypothetical protein [Pseudomonadota bacterium]
MTLKHDLPMLIVGDPGNTVYPNIGKNDYPREATLRNVMGDAGNYRSKVPTTAKWV